MIHKYATGPRCHASSKAQGFTLLEVLIALSLFAVLSAMAFGGLNQLLSQHQQLQHKQQRFVDLQSAIQVLERDFSQLAPRSIRDAFGDPQAALKGSSSPEFTYALSTKTWFNPHLKKLGYRTYSIGKWHLGHFNNASTPLSRGFDYFYGFYSGGIDYLTQISEESCDNAT